MITSKRIPFIFRAIPFRLWYSCILSFIIIAASAQVPVVQGFGPTSGPVGSSVNISGSGFNGSPSNNTVYMGATKAAVTAASSNALTVTVPKGTSYEPFSVTSNGLTGYSVTGFSPRFGQFGTNGFTASSFNIYQEFYAANFVNPTEITITDFDNDGWPDMSTVLSSQVAIYRNTSSLGNISFASYQAFNYNAGSTRSMSAADIDGDGKKDLVLSNGGNNNIVVLRNTSTTGNINFAPPVYVATTNYCGALCVGDFDNDGKTDVAMTSTQPGNNTVYFFRNNSTQGSIAFASNGSLSIGNWLHRLMAADIDGDGKTDVAVVEANFPNNLLRILRNTTVGSSFSFVPSSGFAVQGTVGNNYLESLAGGDADGDGKMDIAVASAANSTVSVFRNSSTVGNIAFAARTDLATGQSPVALAFTDLDGEGRPDLMVVPYNESFCQVLRNVGTTGSLVFEPAVNYATANYLYSSAIAAADLDGDDKPDLALPNRYGSPTSIFVFKNNMATPTISSFAPTTGNMSTLVTIRGTGFSTITGVSFGGVAATSFTVVSDTVITATPGPGNTGAVAVQSHTGGYAQLGGFNFTGPAINSFTPATAGSRTTVTIRGINLNNATEVRFGNVPALGFTVVSDTLISAVVGPGATGQVTVVTPVASAFKAGFTFIPYPYIATFTPDSAGISTTVTIQGKYFTGATAVRFGSTAAASFTIVSDTVIRAVTAGGSSGAVSITNAQGTGSLGGFTFLPLPTITALSPQSAAPGSSIIISGSNFSPVPANNIVSFGGAKALVTAATATSLTVTVPIGASYAQVTVTVTGLTAYSLLSFIPLGTGTGPITSKSFVNRVNFPINSSATNCTMQDLDGDGLPEAIYATDSLWILRNTSTTGNPAFTVPHTLNARIARNTIKPVVADFNGDGKVDIAMGGINGSTEGLWVFQNNSQPGNLNFTGQFMATGIFLARGDVGDFDKDGRVDLVFTTFGSGYSAYFFRNTSSDGNIGFTLGLTVALTGSPNYNLNVADLDGDGKQDVCTANGSGSKVLILRNTSTGPGNMGFATTTLDAVSFVYAKQTAVGDLNGDNKPDIVVLYDNTNYSTFTNQSSTGFMFFTPRTEYPASGQVLDLALGDLDGDGKLDLSLVDVIANTVSTYKNTSTLANIAWASGVQNWSEYNMQGITKSDVDGDGKTDIVLTDRLISVMRNVVREPVIYSLSPVGGSIGSPVTIKGISFTGTTAVSFDGVPVSSFNILSDTVITAVPAARPLGKLSITNAVGTGELGNQYPAPIITQITPSKASAGSLVTIRGNYFADSPTGNIVFFGAVQAQVTAASDTVLVVRVPKAASYAPVTVTANRRTATSASYFTPTFGNGDATLNNRSFEARTDFNINTQSPTLYGNIAIKDLNNDGRPDVGISGENNPTLLTNHSDSARILFAKRTMEEGIFQYPFAAGDVDGDGRPDWVRGSGGNGLSNTTVFRNRSTGTIQFDRSITSRTSYAQSAGTLGYFFSTPTLADLNGDGKPEIISGSNNVSPYRGDVLVMENKSADNIVVQVPLPLFSTGSSAGIMRAADMDGDGKTDILSLRQELDFGFTALRNTSTASAISLAPYQHFAMVGSTTDMALGDLDGDGKTDVAVVNNNGGYFSVFANNSNIGNISFAPKIDITTHAKPYGIAIGDVNGDGKPDVAVTAITDSTVTVYRNISTVGNMAFVADITYKTGHQPFRVGITDADADGQPDLLVMNQGSNTISFFRNRQGQPYTQEMCNPLGSAILAAGISGNNYQWQMSTDSVQYVNIPDTTIFNGTTTANLQLINIPSAWYGRLFRCVVDGQNTQPTIIKFVNRWMGTINTNWNTPGNWSCGTVPDANTDVIISSGNVSLGSSTLIRSLTILSDATLTINNGATLTVTH